MLSISYLRVRVKLLEAIYLSAGRFSYNINHIKYVYNMDLKTETNDLDGNISKN
jgi:hypothetical protein